MATPNDPTKVITETVQKIQDRLTFFLKKLIKKLKSVLAPLTRFLGKLIAVAKDIAETIGKGVISAVIDTGAYVVDFIDMLKDEVKSALKLGVRVLGILRRALDPEKLVKAVKTVLTKYVKAFRAIVGRIIGFFEHLEILETALKAIAGLRMALQMMFRWIGEISGAEAALRKAQAILKKIRKELKLEAKQALRFAKNITRMELS